MKFRLIEDDSHAWLEVPIQVIYDLGIENKITDYSFVLLIQEVAFIEKDVDFGIFVNAAKEAGFEYIIREIKTHTKTKITTYSRFNELKYLFENRYIKNRKKPCIEPL